LSLADRVSSHDVQVLVGFWVYIPPLKTRFEVERKIAELEKRGVQEYYVVDGQGPMKNAISLGIFKTEDAAEKYLETLQQKGVRSARVGSREHGVTQTAFVVREPDVPLTAEIPEHGTLLAIDRASQLLGYHPRHSWRDHIQSH